MTTTQLTIHVPGNHLMRPLLGERDELLRMVEAAFPGASIHVRGNEVAVESNGVRLLLDPFQAVDQHDATRLATSTGVYLCLDHPATALQRLRSGTRLCHG